jgi:hypothetical protein
MAGAPCATRQTELCAIHDLITPQVLLNEQLAAIVDDCGGLPNESSLEAEFEVGCATGLSVSLGGDAAGLLGCIEKALAVRHFICADGLRCARVRRSTLP